ncbi:MAG: ABC transporter ATP-binding protein [Candidatus Kapabacteria bacterium]|nr:ABC transporter ATP-binding protein [Candidatus Kapabacteria bacterium]
MIKFINIHLSFSEKKIFNNFNLNIPAGKVIGLSGQSGIGKSSLLNLVMGFIKPDEGTVLVMEKKINKKNLKAVRSKIAWLPQNFIFAGSGTVLDTINYPFIFEVNSQIKPSGSKIIESLESLNLDGTILSNSFESLSGGEKQRIGLIICKLLGRQIILLDEPSSALDRETSDLAINYILSSGATILLVSHDQNWLNKCDEIVEM